MRFGHIEQFSNPLEGRSNRNRRIIGGSLFVSLGIPQYQVSILLHDEAENEPHHLCSGSIISTNYVVSAAHCFYDISFFFPLSSAKNVSLKDSITVNADSDVLGDGSEHNVENIIWHEKYGDIKSRIIAHSFYDIFPEIKGYLTVRDNTKFNIYDVAVIRVKEPFDDYQVISMFDAGEKIPAYANATVSGWGTTEKGITLKLLYANVTIVNKTACINAYKYYNHQPHESHICATYQGEIRKGVCHGDSGGPLTIDGRLVGIVSWSRGCADPKYPEVYTDISFVREWIDEHTDQHTHLPVHLPNNLTNDLFLNLSTNELQPTTTYSPTYLQPTHQPHESTPGTLVFFHVFMSICYFFGNPLVKKKLD
ncbi:trypsin-like isoform X2 [Sitodiplosis mosellana]|uniref:trypsin-like isoform X2 n=1 Tax=Sitodiplosis mosellana TaxID=263140 RepID=UPI002443C766|nr:trypsin-like isoform X2 [Sitodiplosis mosellana]XP_055312895.1 trypsin-like isoform X2 [Sitodiplosis mosellana]